MHFLVFIPGESVDPATALQSVGLSYMLDDAHFSETVQGPDDIPGRLVGWDSTVPIVYRPLQQTWITAFKSLHMDAGRYQIGLWNDRPPTPRDLLRRSAQRGKAVTFADGQDWTVPRAIDLPFTVSRDASGEVGFYFVREYKAFLHVVDRWREVFDAAKDGDGVPFIELYEFVEQALQINYRLTPEVIANLQMMRSGDGQCLLEAALAIVALANEVP